MGRFTSVIAQDTAAVATELRDALMPLCGGRLVVTGGSGFLCSYLVDTVAAFNDLGVGDPCRVLAVDNHRTGLPVRLAHLAGRDDVELLRHDVTVPLVLDGDADWMVLGAGIASPPVYRRRAVGTVAGNTPGVRPHLEQAPGQRAKGVLTLSTSEIYGDPPPERIPTPEEYRGNVSCTGPRACYDESKRLAETIALTYHRLYATPVNVVRPFNVYGPGQRLDDGRVVPDAMTAALHGRTLRLYSDGRATRAFCYVTDAVAAMLALLVSGIDGEAFNVGNDTEEVSIAELAETLRDVVPGGMDVAHAVHTDADYLTDNPQRRCPDLTKLRRSIGYEPGVPLREGLRRTLLSYREDMERDRVGPENAALVPR